MTVTADDTARLFFALWPAPDLQHALYGVSQEARRECGGRTVQERNIHLTLAFLGNVARGRLPELKAVGAGTIGAPCELVFDRVEYWRHNRILWAGVARCPASLLALVAALSGHLRGIGFELDERPYLPHITLLRDAKRAPVKSTITEIAWPVLDFALIESVDRGKGRTYEVLRRWPLVNV